MTDYPTTDQLHAAGYRTTLRGHDAAMDLRGQWQKDDNRKNDMSDLSTEFEGNEIACVKFRGRHCWIARQVGVALGYAQGGKRFVSSITGKWSDEFRPGKDHDVLAGEALQEFWKACDASSGDRSSGTSAGPDGFAGTHPGPAIRGTASGPRNMIRSVVILYEPGLHLALQKTTMPKGKQLRRHLADDVLPQLARDGQYSDKREVVNGEIQVRAEIPKSDEPVPARLDAELRMIGAQAIGELIKHHKDAIGPEAVQTLRWWQVEVATKKDCAALKPTVIDPGWESPTKIAKRNGVSVQKIGRIISDLKIRGNIPDIARCINTSAPKHGKPVEVYVYSPKAVAMIEEKLRDTDHESEAQQTFDAVSVEPEQPTNGQSGPVHHGEVMA